MSDALADPGGPGDPERACHPRRSAWVHLRRVVVLVVSGAAVAAAQEPPASPGLPANRPEPYSRACLDRIVAILIDRKAVHDGADKPGLQSPSGADAQAIPGRGLYRGELPIQSHVQPPSRYLVFQYAAASPPKNAALCPLDQTYVAFVQGGFSQQGSRLFGPIR